LLARIEDLGRLTQVFSGWKSGTTGEGLDVAMLLASL